MINCNKFHYRLLTMKSKFIFILFFIFSSFSVYAQSLRIEPELLNKELIHYKIIDVRDKKEYLKTHIKSSINFPADLTYEDMSLDGRITNPNKMQEIFKNLGLDINDNIVIYDDGSFFDASRVFWSLEVYNFKNVKILNAGFNEWEEKNFEISNEIPKTNVSNYIATIDNKKLSTKFSTQIATKNPNQVIIDARSYEEYIGKKSAAKRYGHIPKAIHIPAVENLNKKETMTKLKNLDSLKDLYKNIDKKQKVIIYCSIGKIASTNYFALRELGYNVSNYDASWKEWGNDFSLPIINQSETIN